MMFITMDNVFYSYNKDRPFMENLNMQLDNGHFIAIKGPNGGGKTTFGKLMAGILKPDRGRVLIEGNDTKKMSLGQIGSRIGYMFQNPERQLFASTVWEELTFVLELKGMNSQEISQRVNRVMDILHIGHLKNQFPYTLSQGEKKRVAMGAVLINNPRFLILDEPTTGLDVERKNILSQILDNLLKQGIGMAVISHDNDFLDKHAQRTIEISDGGIVIDVKNTS